jgi:hypothetical protein
VHWLAGKLGQVLLTQLILPVTLTTVVGSVALHTFTTVQLLMTVHVLLEVHVAVTTPA